MQANKVVKNASWIIVCKIIQSALGLVVTMLSARFLGPSGYGLINYAASIVAFFTMPISLTGYQNCSNSLVSYGAIQVKSGWLSV